MRCVLAGAVLLSRVVPCFAQDAADIEFSLVPQGDQTQVTWSMSGKNDDFFSKAVCLVMDMDQMIGDKYDQGLANLKRIVEAAGEPAEVAKGRDDSAAKADEPAGD